MRWIKTIGHWLQSAEINWFNSLPNEFRVKTPPKCIHAFPNKLLVLLLLLFLLKCCKLTPNINRVFIQWMNKRLLLEWLDDRLDIILFVCVAWYQLFVKFMSELKWINGPHVHYYLITKSKVMLHVIIFLLLMLIVIIFCYHLSLPECPYIVINYYGIASFYHHLLLSSLPFIVIYCHHFLLLSYIIVFYYHILLSFSCTINYYCHHLFV